MISDFLQREIQSLEDQGYVILLKWDGERSENRKTVLLTHHGKDISLRIDGEDMTSMIQSLLEELEKSRNPIS